MGRIETGMTLALLLAAISSARADAGTEGEETRVPKRSGPLPRFYVLLEVGGFDAAGGASYLDESEGGALLGGGFGWNLKPFLAAELEAVVASESHPLPASASGDFETDPTLVVSNAGLVARVRFGRYFGRVRPHVGLGAGLGLTDVSVSAGGGYGEPLESELAPLSEWSAGLDVRVGKQGSVGLELRHLEAHRDIELAGQRIDSGGEAVLFNWRFGFGEGGTGPATKRPAAAP